ncbi:hypothetical protein CROQUDRAFT_654910 [Cronartium quercuum f. sp. fusiforme G11]|uniref:DH domain-containing protein n=1 Tax=Cronartium quercuum f. sp. fusiforme G11 TaxID=708437 RepID=A0A9P6NJZ0_9BASI|nr:hypothetical protein CROQUDRAFT_654910 [Cronartium quercuum f. sp. fusiforme G11]
MPSFHLPSPSPYSSSSSSSSSSACLQNVDPNHSFLWLQSQHARSNLDLMARRARKRYAQLPAKALLDTLPILPSPSPSHSPPPSSTPQLDSHLESPTLNLFKLINNNNNNNPMSTLQHHLSIPPNHLGPSSSTLSTSSASLTPPHSLFDHHLRPPSRPRRHPTPGRTSHSMMNLNQSPFSDQRTPDHFRYSHLIPRSSSDHRSSWHPPSTSTSTSTTTTTSTTTSTTTTTTTTTTSTSPPTPELITSSNSTQRPISTAYTTTTSASSSLPEPSFRRARAIAELVDTEVTYARDMTVARDIYLANARAELVPGGLLPPSSFPTRSSISSQSFKRPATASTTLNHSSSPKTCSSSTFATVFHFGSKKRASAALRNSCTNTTTPLSLPQKTPSSTITSNSSGPTNGPPITPLDRKVVFSNLEEVTTLAETFAALLADAGASDIDRPDSIGACFYQMLPKIEQVFMAYCAKYESANNRLQELAPNLTEYLDQCQLLARGRTTAWDLPSLLIKPVQRCLKYPLLLDQILQLTPLGHPDRAQLERAKAGMIAVADSINEAKRRYEYIEEIVGSNKSLPRRKTSRRAGAPPSALVARALNRRIPHRSSTDSVLAHMIERLEQSRRALMRLPATLMAWSLRMRDMSEHSGKFVEALRVLYLNVPTHHQPPSPGMPWFPQIWNGQPDVRHLQTYQHHVATAASIGPFKVMDSRLRSEIIPLCEQLNGLYENPMAVIARRDAKEAELAHSTNPVKVRELIRAIDAQLLAELPRFELAAARFLDGILRKLAKIQQDASFDLRTLLRHFEKSLSKPTTTTLDQGACIEKLERLAIVNGSSLDRHRQHHESFVFLEHAPMLRVDDQEDVVVGNQDQIGIAMTTSSPVLAARY